MSELSNHLDIPGLTLFTAEPAPHLHEVHAHDAYSIIVLTSGAKQFHHAGSTTQVNTHQIAISNPGELHGCGPIDDQPWSHRTWYLSQELMAEIAETVGLDPQVYLTAPVIRDEELAKTLIDAHIQCDEGELFDQQVVALEALERLVKTYASSAPQEQAQTNERISHRMKIYHSLMDQEFTRPIELNELANQVGVKRNQVIRDFRQSCGVTPNIFLRQLRLNHAKKLIQAGADLVSTSLDSGFSDQSHFTRSFKKAFGVTPKHFQKLSLESGGKAPL